MFSHALAELSTIKVHVPFWAVFDPSMLFVLPLSCCFCPLLCFWPLPGCFWPVFGPSQASLAPDSRMEENTLCGDLFQHCFPTAGTCTITKFWSCSAACMNSIGHWQLSLSTQAQTLELSKLTHHGQQLRKFLSCFAMT